MRSNRNRAAKARLIDVGLVLMPGAIPPAMAQERLEQDIGAPTGTAAALTAPLTGRATPAFNECGSE
jgi:hypothetical protein